MRNPVLTLSFTLFLVRAGGFVRNDCFCGIGNDEGRRITKGVITEPWKYPWMVLILTKYNKAYCGGALISDRHVLSAAHCVSFNPLQLEYWESIYGQVKSHDIFQGDKMDFDQIHIHPKFKSLSSYDDFDMAILRFRMTIQQLSRKVRPICVPITRQDYGGMSATIAGWGTTQEGVMEMSTYLREGEIKIVPAAQCPAATSLHHLYNFESMICAYSSQQVDTCQGDSGGPLIIQLKPNIYDVIGVISFGDGCGRSHAGIYSDVTQSLPWIWSIINNTGICPRPA